MAALTFTIPAAAMASLDAYAQRRNYADFRAYELEHIKNSVRNARREEREQQAADALAAQPADPNIT